jgi:hypothetical protein
MTHIICPNCGQPVELYPLPAADQPAYAGAPVLASLPFHPGLIRAPGVPPLPLSDAANGVEGVQTALLALADDVWARLEAPRQAAAAPPEADCEDCP